MQKLFCLILGLALFAGCRSLNEKKTSSTSDVIVKEGESTIYYRPISLEGSKVRHLCSIHCLGGLDHCTNIEAYFGSWDKIKAGKLAKHAFVGEFEKRLLSGKQEKAELKDAAQFAFFTQLNSELKAGRVNDPYSHICAEGLPFEMLPASEDIGQFTKSQFVLKNSLEEKIVFQFQYRGKSADGVWFKMGWDGDNQHFTLNPKTDSKVLDDYSLKYVSDNAFMESGGTAENNHKWVVSDRWVIASNHIRFRFARAKTDKGYVSGYFWSKWHEVEVEPYAQKEIKVTTITVDESLLKK